MNDKTRFDLFLQRTKSLLMVALLASSLVTVMIFGHLAYQMNVDYNTKISPSIERGSVAMDNLSGLVEDIAELKPIVERMAASMENPSDLLALIAILNDEDVVKALEDGKIDPREAIELVPKVRELYSNFSNIQVLT